MSGNTVWKKIGAGALLIGYGVLRLLKPGALPDIKQELSPQEINIVQGDTSKYYLKGTKDRMPINEKYCRYTIKGKTVDNTKNVIYEGYGDKEIKTFYLKNIKYTSPDTSFYYKLKDTPKTTQEQIWQKQYTQLVNEYINAREKK